MRPTSRLTSQRTNRCGQSESTGKVWPKHATAPASLVRRRKMRRPVGIACRSSCQVGGIAGRGGAAVRRAARRTRAARTKRSDRAQRAARDSWWEAAPDFRLPASIEILDGVLKPVLAHGRDAQAQAEPHDPAHDIAMLMRTLKARVIIELGIGGQPHGSPMGQQGGQSRHGREEWSGPRPDSDRPATRCRSGSPGAARPGAPGRR